MLELPITRLKQSGSFFTFLHLFDEGGHEFYAKISSAANMRNLVWFCFGMTGALQRERVLCDYLGSGGNWE